MTKREVGFERHVYKVRSNTVEIPDLYAMPRTAALIWLNRNTYPRGISRRKPNPLAGLAGIFWSAGRAP